MNSIDILRNSIIDKLMTISNMGYLSALDNIIQKNDFTSSATQLTSVQILMLQLSETDIENGDLINQSVVDREDLKWLKTL